jgi:DNA-binding NtrC family response regulator
MSGSSATGSLPYTLLDAHARLCEALDLGIHDFEAYQRFSNSREICLAAERFVREFCSVPAWRAELERRVSLVDNRTRQDSEFRKAMGTAWKAYRKNPKDPFGPESSKSKQSFSCLRKAIRSPILVVEVLEMRQYLERVIDAGLLRPRVQDAFKDWLRQCWLIQHEAERLEVDGCYYLHHVYQAIPNPSERSKWAKAKITSETFFGGFCLKPMHAAADSLVAWAAENPAGTVGPAGPTGQQKPEEAVPADGTGEEDRPGAVDDATVGDAAFPPHEADQQGSEELVGLAPPANRIGKQDYDRLRKTKAEIDPKNTYIGSSVAILRVFEKLDLYNMDADRPVLLLGPTGSGKTRLAELIHKSSPRREGRYQVEQATANKHADMANILVRWVGHGKGSGLPSVPPDGTTGRLQECSGGTVFIDEVEILSEDFQAFLFQVLDGTPIQRASGTGEAITPNVRLLFSTNKDLEALVDADKFRHDLYGRIRLRTLSIPALDDRKEDLLEFVRMKYGEHKRTPDFLLALLRHKWSGGSLRNVGELLNVIDLTISKTAESRKSLTAKLLDLPTAQEVATMDPKDVDKELVEFLTDTLERQGFEKGKGLQKEMAKILGVSKVKISSMCKS